MKNYNCLIETLGSIFTIDQGLVKVLLFRKKTEPYKGYWVLPGGLVKVDETLEENIISVISETTGFNNVHYEQSHVFSNLLRDSENRLIAVSFIGLVDSISVNLKNRENSDIEMKWFNINTIPKLGYDHDVILKQSINYLKSRMLNISVLKSLFPSDFTLPELQKMYEQILNKKLDRRNFRKKFISLNLVKDTGDKNEKTNGRPAKLYEFNDDIAEVNIF